MAKFIRASTEVVEYRGRKMANLPLNIDLVTKIIKTTVAHYPDNEGIPAIKFFGVDETWVYDDIEIRDSDYIKIINK